MTTAYRGYRNDNPAGNRLVTVQDDNGETPLPHLVRHSPDGFSWGYAGSGPSDLALAIIAHATGDPEPRPDLYQKFKFAFVANLPADEDWVIPQSIVQRWVEENG